MVPERVADSALLATSQQSACSVNKGKNAPQSASASYPTLEKDQNECLRTKLTEDIEIIAAYLAVESTPAYVGYALRRV